MSDPGRQPPAEPSGNQPGQTQANYREVTVAALVFAVLIGVVMNAAITYAGLKIGFTIGGSAIAAVLSFGVLRGVLRKGSILECNIAQTVASAVNTSNSGVIFTVPVLLLLGITLAWDRLDFWLITLACVAGAFLGTAFIIPLRKQMIDIERLRFPSGTGVAVILKSPGAGAKKSLVLLAGIGIGALIYLPIAMPALADTFKGMGMDSMANFANAFSYTSLGNLFGGKGQTVLEGEMFNLGKMLGIPAQFQLVFAVAPFALGAGFITGRPGLLVLAGGILAYFVITPIAYANNWLPATVPAADAGDFARNAFNKPLGIGLLLGGAIMGVLYSLPSIKEALKSIASAGKTKAGADELGLKPLIFAGAAALVLLFLAADFVGDKPINPICPVTGLRLVADAHAPDSVDVAKSETPEGLIAEGQGPDADGAPEVVVEKDQQAIRHYKGYALRFASEAAAVTFTGWPDTQKKALLDDLNAKPGWLSALPSHLRAAIIAIVGALWIWFAGIIIAQCTGMTDWSPISGMALLTVVLVLLLAGTGAVIGAVLIGAALCVAITLAADMMSDLRTGHLVGAKPRRQQIVELCVVGIGPVISMLVILLIAQANLQQFGVQMGEGTPTTAPQAQALKAVITGVQGGEMPYALYGFGTLIGALLGLGAFSGLGVLVGLSMYLPFFYIATYGVGCVVQMILSKAKGPRFCEQWGVPFAAGLIVGESILSLLVNLVIIAV